MTPLSPREGTAPVPRRATGGGAPDWLPVCGLQADRRARSTPFPLVPEVVVQRIALLVVAAALAGCASSRPSLARLDPETRSPTSAERVEVLAASPQRPHRVIGRWSGNARGTDAQQEQKLQQQAVQEAAQLGADAVVLHVDREVDAQLQSAESGVAVASPIKRSTRMVAEVVVWEQR